MKEGLPWRGLFETGFHKGGAIKEPMTSVNERAVRIHWNAFLLIVLRFVHF